MVTPVEVSFVNVSTNLMGAVIVEAGIVQGGVNRILINDGLTRAQFDALSAIFHDLLDALKAGHRTITINVENGKITGTESKPQIDNAVSLALASAKGDHKEAAFNFMRALINNMSSDDVSTASKAEPAPAPKGRKKKAVPPTKRGKPKSKDR